MKTERETELINEQVLIEMSEMGLDRERTLQVGVESIHTSQRTLARTSCLLWFPYSTYI